MKNFISQLDLSDKNLTVSDKRRSLSKYSADFATFKVSIPKIEDLLILFRISRCL